MRKKELSVGWIISLSIMVTTLALAFSSRAYSAAENIKASPADKTDVQIIENKAKPSGPEKLILTKEITIGKLQEGGSIFNGLGGAEVTSDGRIIALDSKDKKIKIFDAAGQKIKEFGQEGQGPGEWTSPIVLQLISDREIMVSDAGNRKLVYLDLEGKMLKEVSYAKKLAMMKIIDAGGQYVGCEMGMEGNSIAYTIAKYDAEFNQLFKIETLLMPVPVSGTRINPFDIIYDFCLDNRGNIIYSSKSGYEIKYYTPSGQLFRILRKEYKPEPLTEKEKEEMLKQMPQNAGINFRELFDFPATYPAVSSFFVDEKDRLYVRTNEKGKTKDSYFIDIFSPEGKFIYRCELVGTPFLMKNGKLYTEEKDEEGYQYICRYQATWKK
ncbi:MAG TPA: 6-bladed beta-propeller [Candidatus Saccharicenans sp.]|nr:6-bladed beta-propeller [Candidatus Saccharicenans sp.]